MKRAMLTLTLGFFLAIFSISFAQSEACANSTRVGRGLIYSTETQSNCAKETHIVGRGIVPKHTILEAYQ